ncbi:hypothetical protein E2C01_045782 [Portunus trituberculatus]|uniref:Uncharacterized protein n=1 Tax=Portunus trituberculatus TaxID=210409 RepID=A0A5B7G3B5_PORTR|nr:hypothetical protein [Portunus trituberculatus]
MAASTPGSSGSQSSSKSARWVCSRPDCTRVLGSFLQDPHSVCVNCRDICNPGKRCGECSTWSSDKVLAAYKYQCGLRRRRCPKAKHSHSSVAQPFYNVSCDVGTSQFVKAPPSVQGTRDSPAASVLSKQDLGASTSPGPGRAQHDSERHDGIPTCLESDGHEFPPYAPSMYHHMVNYIGSVFEDAVGAMYLLAARNLPAHLLDLEEQLFKAVCVALNDTCRDSTCIFANLWAWRREAYLGCLRPSFSQVKKGILWRSSIFTPLLFDEDQLQEALQSLKSNADLTLHKAVLRAHAQPRPAPGTPLVECGPWPSTTMAVRPSAAPARRPPIAAPARDSEVGFCGSHSSRPGGQGGGWKDKPFQK